MSARWLLRALLVTLFVAWSAAHLDGFSWDYDEGIHVYIAWLMQQGQPLYTQTFSPYTPGLLVALSAAFNLFGATVYTARMLSVALAALGLLSVMRAARALLPPSAPTMLALVAEGGAGLLLMLTPAFVQWSRAAMSDLPSAALMALAVACALIFLRAGRLRWLFAAEFALACALWVKLISVGGAAALLLALLLAVRARRGDAHRALFGSLLMGALALLPLLAFDVRALFEQAIYFHVQKRAAFDQSLADKFFLLADFLAANSTLSILAAFGVLASALSAATRAFSLVVLTWFAATFAALLAQTPLFANHHPVVLAFALAALAGAGLAHALEALYARRPVPRFAAALLVLLVALLGLSAYPAALAASVAPPPQPAAEDAVRLLSALTAPDDWLVSDAQMIAFRAQRRAPPALSDTSAARLASGNLNAQDLIVAAQQPPVNAVLFWSGRLESSAAFVEWVERNYHPVQSSWQKPNAPFQFWLRMPHPQHALDARLGEGIRLWGYDLNRRAAAPARAGQSLSLTLYFERVGAIAQSYTVFTHLLGADGRVVSQSDRLPLDGRRPTDQWRAGEYIADEFVLALDGVSAGEYTLELGMYRRETLQRVPIMLDGVRQPDDRVWLRAITIAP